MHRDLVAELNRSGVTDLRADTLTRAIYSTDASLYRVTPQVVVRPRDEAEVLAVLDVCTRLGVPVTSRGGGTSIAGNSIGSGVVMDFTVHMNKVLDLDPQARSALVEPGTVHASLQQAAVAAGLRFGPDPSSHTRCAVGGMIGNNACGSRALGYGRTSDNVLGLRIITGTGTVLETAMTAPGRYRTTGATAQMTALKDLVAGNLATIRTEFGTFGRQVSGYALDRLLPENGFDVGGAFVGSEGTLGILTQATVRLVTDPPCRILVVLGYPDIAAAGDAAPQVVRSRPVACEAIDSRIVDVLRARRSAAAVPELPAGNAWLFVELAGQTDCEVMAAAEALCRDAQSLSQLIVPDAKVASTLWRIREDGAGLASRSPSGQPAHAGWEDAAVPPAKLGAYLRDFAALMSAHHLTGLMYGHFAEGCIHVRLDHPFDEPGAVARFREFTVAAAHLVAGYGGSLSGEHGDGRARSELLPLMYSKPAIGLFAGVKHIFDPGNLLNPGVMVDPEPFDANLRLPAPKLATRHLGLSYHSDGGDFSQAVHRCSGVGKCRADNTANGGVMCPSYLATKDEKDSTRGRARALQEMINGETIAGGWRSPEVHQALDLCLSCKGCASDCPTGVDMASYKAEVLYQSYRRRLRPVSHYSLGWLPRWARIASAAPGLANRLLNIPALGPLALTIAGIDQRRTIPRFARSTFRRLHKKFGHQGSRQGRPVLLMIDTFTNYFTPEVAIAAVAVLRDAGYEPQITQRQDCCGLTWISTGQLDTARKLLGQTIDGLRPAAQAGIPVVGLEPSCTAVIRSESLELLDDELARPVAENIWTLAEFLARDPDWQAPDLGDQAIVAQPHCHHHAVMGWDADDKLLRATGATVKRLGGCCGLAGNFGVERGHYEVSVAVAEHQLIPAIEASTPDTVLLADGFSCRTQISDLTQRSGLHLAQLLAQQIADHPATSAQEPTG